MDPYIAMHVPDKLQFLQQLHRFWAFVFADGHYGGLVFLDLVVCLRSCFRNDKVVDSSTMSFEVWVVLCASGVRQRNEGPRT